MVGDTKAQKAAETLRRYCAERGCNADYIFYSLISATCKLKVKSPDCFPVFQKIFLKSRSDTIRSATRSLYGASEVRFVNLYPKFQSALKRILALSEVVRAMPVYFPTKYKKQLPADIGNEETEAVLDEMIAEIESVYGQAYTELKAKADDYLAWFVAEDAAQLERLKNGQIAVKEYQNWRQRKLLTGQHWYAMAETMADNLANSNGIACSIISDYLPEVYAINGNWMTYQIEHQLKINTSFELYDHQTVERLIRENPDLLPQPKVNIPLDKRWNKQNLQSAVMQSILQGESVDQLADRLAGVSDMNRTSAVRNAKTMTTSAQNGGRQAAMERAETLGIKGKKMWVSTLDHHTRASHIDLDGEIVEINEKFSNGLMYPGDPSGEPADLYNCRCREVEVFDDQDIHNAERFSRLDNHLGEMTYDEWKESHREGKQFRAAANVNRDYSMMREYRQLLGSKVPTNIKEFQKIKYNEPEKWKQWISEARKARAERRRQNGG